jgi:hypothetical protein
VDPEAAAAKTALTAARTGKKNMVIDLNTDGAGNGLFIPTSG